VEDVVEVPGVPRNRRLGRAVKVPDEDLAFVTDEALEEILAPEALNSGNVIDIYQNREEDFLATSTLEVTYRDASGEEVSETLFVDNLYPQHLPRICVSVQAVQAMHKAIAVLTRKVDNLSMTLRSCREHYYKELFFLRHGRKPEQEHEVYWFNPKAYQDLVTKQIMRERLTGRELKLQEELDAMELEMERMRLSLDTQDDDMTRLKKILGHMPLDQLFQFLRTHNSAREVELFAHLNRVLNEWKQSKEDGSEEKGDGDSNALLERLEASEAQVKHMGEMLQASNARNTVLCQQIKSLGGVPGLLTEEAKPGAEAQQEESELERLRRQERLQVIEENRARREGLRGNTVSLEVLEDLRQQVTEGNARADAWEAESKKLMDRLMTSQRELSSRSSDLDKAKKHISRLWLLDPKAKSRTRRRLHVNDMVIQELPNLEDDNISSRSGYSRSANSPTPYSPTQTTSPTRFSPSPSQEHLTSVSTPSHTRSSMRRRTHSKRSESRSPRLSFLDDDQESCTCGVALLPGAPFCMYCGLARQDIVQDESRRRRRPRSAPPERARPFCVRGLTGRRDDWWKDAEPPEITRDPSSNSSSSDQGPASTGTPRSLGPRSAARLARSGGEMQFLQRRRGGQQGGEDNRADPTEEAENLEVSRKSRRNPSFTPDTPLRFTIKVEQAVQTDAVRWGENALREPAAAVPVQEVGEFVVTNLYSKADTLGLLYCKKKDAESQAEILAEWGTTIMGCDEGDGWVRVGDHYLPKQLGDVPVLVPQTEEEYRVNNDSGDSQAPGLQYYSSKQLNPGLSDLAKWGTTILASDEGEDWVRVGDKFLPKEVNYLPVLELQVTDSYLVFDALPEAEMPGLTYCLRKRLDCAMNATAKWGTIVHGTDEGDWVKVGDYYLPKEMQGAKVLIMQPNDDFVVCEAPAETDSGGIPVCLEKRLDAQCGLMEWGSSVRGVDHGDGWVKVGEYFLPKKVEGLTVLSRQAQGEFRVSHSLPNMDTPGVPYCLKKQLDTNLGAVAERGTIVNGSDEGDGWVKVDELYLPKEVDGVSLLSRQGRHEYLVRQEHPDMDTAGVPYCRTKELGEKYGLLAKPGMCFRGFDEGDGWIKVGDHYLPKEIDGKPMLGLKEAEDYVVCDANTGLERPGLPYCSSKQLDTASGITAKWGTVVRGSDEGDGWIKVGNHFLPMEIQGMPVLTPKARKEYSVVEGHPDMLGMAGLPYLRHKRHGEESKELAPWGSTVVGCDEGDGWIKVGRYYLPKEIGGSPVLISDDTEREYSVATSHPEVESVLGMPFFREKALDARSFKHAPWGSTIQGCDEGDGWVKVAGFYLPKELAGVPVLTLKEVFKTSAVVGDGGAASPVGAVAMGAGTDPETEPEPGTSTGVGDAGSGPIAGAASTGTRACPITGAVAGIGARAGTGTAAGVAAVTESTLRGEGLLPPLAEEQSEVDARTGEVGGASACVGEDGPEVAPPQPSAASSRVGFRVGSPAQIETIPIPAAGDGDASNGAQVSSTAHLHLPTRHHSKHRPLSPLCRVVSPTRSLTPETTRTPTPATWQPNLDESRTGSSALVSRPTSTAGQRVRTMNAEVQTLVCFSAALSGWSLDAPHNLNKHDRPEAFALGVWMRHFLLDWCLNCITELVPGILPADLIQGAMQRCWEACAELSACQRSDDERSRGISLQAMPIVTVAVTRMQQPQLLPTSSRARSSVSESSTGSGLELPPSGHSSRGPRAGATPSPELPALAPRRERPMVSRQRLPHTWREFTVPYLKHDAIVQTSASMKDVLPGDGQCPFCGRLPGAQAPEPTQREVGACPEPEARECVASARTPDPRDAQESEGTPASEASRLVAEAEDPLGQHDSVDSTFAPLKLSDLVSCRMTHAMLGTKGGGGIAAGPRRRSSLTRGSWRQEVAQGGVSNRDSETIVRGSRRRPVVEKPSLLGGGPRPRQGVSNDLDLSLDIELRRPQSQRSR